MSLSSKWSQFINENDLKPAGIVICVDNNQRFLIIRRSNIDERGGMWTIPGGHIDEEDRSIEAGALRELDEETDLLSSAEDLIYLGEAKPKKFYFLTQRWNGTVNIEKPNPKTGYKEHDEFEWATIEEIKEIANSEIPIYLLEKALKIIGFESNDETES